MKAYGAPLSRLPAPATVLNMRSSTCSDCKKETVVLQQTPLRCVKKVARLFVVLLCLVVISFFLLGCNFFLSLSLSHTRQLYRHVLLLTGEHEFDLQ